MSFESIVPVSVSNDTLLQISGLGTLLWQGRGLTQTFDVINAAKQQERTINGILKDISNTMFRKYLSKISCTDNTTPPLDNVWPGMTVTVHCAAELCYQTGNTGSPARPQVSGSSYTQGSFTFYRPIMTMMVVNLAQHLDEWKCVIGWDLELEEI
jgi:hypothetical protein